MRKTLKVSDCEITFKKNYKTVKASLENVIKREPLPYVKYVKLLGRYRTVQYLCTLSKRDCSQD